MATICDGCNCYGNHEGIKPYDNHELCSDCRDKVEEFIKKGIIKRNTITVKGNYH